MILIGALFLAAAGAGYAHPELLVDTAWAAAHSNDANVRILDLRRSGYETSHIPNALWLDPESIRAAAAPPDFLPTPAAFGETMQRLGISDRTRIILYDDRGGLLAARLWWMLNAYGHPNVALIDGGWVKWTAEKRPSATAAPNVPEGRFHARLNRAWLATADDVRAAIGHKGIRILDARTAAEIDGSDTRLSKRGGAIPSAVPVYWEDLLDPVAKTFKPAPELRAVYEKQGIRPSDELIAYCWVGHRSAVDLFAARLIGYNRLRNYLGSWEEWSKRSDLPAEPMK